MCQFQRINEINENRVPMCEYTNSLCTLCVLGNANTYNEAVKATEKGGAE